MSSETERARRAVAAARRDIVCITNWAAGATLASLQADTKLRYAIERAFMTLNAAIRDIPPAAIERHGLPARSIAGLRNILAHTYDDVLDERIVSTMTDDLPALDAQLAVILADLDAG